ncbi:hypothetical protein B0J17DRAFT_649160 [Rhizoctonia solani]|nr:hypothetical protein B0J17DRAFT_649160 [Rhizoctonia solani]
MTPICLLAWMHVLVISAFHPSQVHWFNLGANCIICSRHDHPNDHITLKSQDAHDGWVIKVRSTLVCTLRRI